MRGVGLALFTENNTAERWQNESNRIAEILRQFSLGGIDVVALGSQLQDEGAKSFVKSWAELMEVITSKCPVAAGRIGQAASMYVKHSCSRVLKPI